MIGVTAKLNVKPEAAEEFEGVFLDLMDAVKANEPGCLIYQFAETTMATTVLELYESEEALAAHGQSDHFKAAGAGFKGKMGGPPEVKRMKAVTGRLVHRQTQKTRHMPRFLYGRCTALIVHIKQISQLIGHRSAELFGIGNRHRALIVVGHIMTNTNRHKLYRRIILNHVYGVFQMLFQIIAGVHQQR